MTITEAQEKYVYLNTPGAYVGPYRSDTSPYMREPCDTLQSRFKSGVVFVGPAQSGKALALDTPIRTPTGWTIMGELEPGDTVYGDDGKPTRVIAAHSTLHFRHCYAVVFDDGERIVCDGDHLWTMNVHRNLSGWPRDRLTLRTVEMYAVHARTAYFSIGNVNPETGNWVQRFVTSVERVPSVPVRCIAVNNDSHLFLAGRQMVPTHNTESLILGWLAYSIKVDPMDMIIYNPSQIASRDFSTRRIDRLHKNSKEVGSVLLRNRDSDNKFDKHYRTGMILQLSHCSSSEFAGKPVGRIALTDYDRMPDDIDGEGNPFDLGTKRTTTFRSFGMTCAESSPSKPVENPRWIRQSAHEAPPCKGILSLYNRGDRRRYYWPCPHCDQYFEGNWSQMHWETRATVLESAETAHLVCPNPKCGQKIFMEHRRNMLAWGVWLREGQSIDDNGHIVGKGVRSTIASFWLKGIAAAFTTWRDLVVNFLNAKEAYDKTQSEEELKKFFNTDLAEPYESKAQEVLRLPESLKGEAMDLPYEILDEHEDVERMNRLELIIRPMVPPDVRFLIAAVDVQANAFVVQVHGVSPGEPYDLTVIDRFKILKSDRLDHTGERLWVKPATYLTDWDKITTEVINRTYALAGDEQGRRMTIKLTVCDSGGQAGATTNAYSYFRKLRANNGANRFHLVKGDAANPSRPRTMITFPDSNQRGNNAIAKGDVPIILINSNTMKDSLVNRLESRVTGKGMFRYPGWLMDWWFAEMCVETRTEKGWVSPNHRRNEAFDLSYYALAACVSSLIQAENIDWKRPPDWAKGWDENSLVIRKGKKEAFALREQKVYDMAKLAGAIA